MSATVTTKCPICKETSEVEVSVEGLAQYKAGALIQDALPELSVDDREKLITGIDDCWDSLFPDEEEE